LGDTSLPDVRFTSLGSHQKRKLHRPEGNYLKNSLSLLKEVGLSGIDHKTYTVGSEWRHPNDGTTGRSWSR
jgi:hypothetical protein